MRAVYRFEDNRAYWDRRWAEAGRDADAFSRLDIYPIKYAEMVMVDRSARAVELGAGLGRVLKHYQRAGFKISGIERSQVAVGRLQREDPALDIRVGDVCDLSLGDGEIDVVLAFGLYHNIEDRAAFDRALRETARCLREGGRFCVSMRPNNVEMRLNEVYWRRRNRSRRGNGPRFHKWLVGEREFRAMLGRHGLQVERIERARNVSILYRVPFLRAGARDETERRSAGYRLNTAGRALDGALVRLLPAQFCNVLVFIGRKGAASW